MKNGCCHLKKAVTDRELFSEILAFKVGKLLNLPMAEYVYDEVDDYLKSKDFTINVKLIKVLPHLSVFT